MTVFVVPEPRLWLMRWLITDSNCRNGGVTALLVLDIYDTVLSTASWAWGQYVIVRSRA
jgi:hypothetical protein